MAAIRPFTDADVPALTALLHDAYAELGASGLNFTAVDQNDATTRHRATAGATWVVDQGDEPIATLTISWPPSATLRSLTPEATAPGRAWLNQMAVSPRRRGEGIASALWRQGLAWARAGGIHSIGVDTAAPATHLLALYERWGFVPAGEIHWPGKTYDSVVMIRMLDG